MRLPDSLAREAALAAKFAAVSLIGFLVDYLALRAGEGLGLGPPVARLMSLVLALQVTFGLSHWLVFHPPASRRIAGEWWRFMVANGFGGVCNYAIFVALTAARWPVVSGPSAALILSAGAAYAINYAGTRLFVYGRDLAASPGKPPTAPQPAAEG